MIAHRRKDYFNPPHGGRPPSDEAVAKATRKYVADEQKALAEKAAKQQPAGKST